MFLYPGLPVSQMYIIQQFLILYNTAYEKELADQAAL